MSKNATIAENQQGSLSYATLNNSQLTINCQLLKVNCSQSNDPSETTRRAPFLDKEIKAYFLGALHDGTFSQNKRFRISQKGQEI